MPDTNQTEPLQIEQVYGSRYFDLAAPGDAQDDLWILRFNDTDMRDQHFDNAADAWAAWNRFAPTWNCRLFQTARFERDLRNSQSQSGGEFGAFDAGLLNDYGGGNIEWWQDYIRSLLGQAHEHYCQFASHPTDQPRADERLREALEKCCNQFEFYAKEHAAKAAKAKSEWDDAKYWGNVAEQEKKRAEFQKRARQTATNQEFVELCCAALADAPQPAAPDVERACDAFMNKITIDGNGGIEFLEEGILAARAALEGEGS